MTTSGRTNLSHRLSIDSAKPSECMIQMTPVPTSRTPDKHALNCFMTQKAPSYLLRTEPAQTASSNLGIRRSFRCLQQGFATIWTCLAYPERFILLGVIVHAEYCAYTRMIQNLRSRLLIQCANVWVYAVTYQVGCMREETHIS